MGIKNFNNVLVVTSSWRGWWRAATRLLNAYRKQADLMNTSGPGNTGRADTCSSLTPTPLSAREFRSCGCDCIRRTCDLLNASGVGEALHKRSDAIKRYLYVLENSVPNEPDPFPDSSRSLNSLSVQKLGVRFRGAGPDTGGRECDLAVSTSPIVVRNQQVPTIRLYA